MLASLSVIVHLWAHTHRRTHTLMHTLNTHRLWFASCGLASAVQWGLKVPPQPEQPWTKRIIASQVSVYAKYREYESPLFH